MPNRPLKAENPDKRQEAPKPSLSPEALVEMAVKVIATHKGVEPVILQVRGLCGFADYFLICSGTSRRHVVALAQHLEEEMARAGVKPLGVEGLQEGHWVLLDYNDVVVHVFLQPFREFYDLEGLWAEAEKVSFETLSTKAVPSET